MSDETKSSTSIEDGIKSLKAQLEAVDSAWFTKTNAQQTIAAVVVMQTLPIVSNDPIMLTAVLLEALKMTVDAGMEVINYKDQDHKDRKESGLLGALKNFLTPDPGGIN